MTSLIELAQFLAASPTLLVVEDDVSAASLLLKMLERFDCEVVHVSTVSEGIDEVFKHKYDLALVDLMFPVGSGVDVIRTVKAHRPEMPVIVMTGYLDHPVVQEALAYGVVTLMRKPVDFRPDYIRSVLEMFKIKARPRIETYATQSALCAVSARF